MLRMLNFGQFDFRQFNFGQLADQKPELNPKPRTLHPTTDGPFRWTPPSGEQPSAGQPSAGQPSAGPPKILLFFSLLPPQFSFFFLSLGSFR